ncbi:nuclear envelope phosphatase regulatory subunit [Trichuris trichiura]|uniref:Transmembrane protein 188 n=1 Tax=Trichuris trichiura TaxID=36087 RepID=A0A077Z4Q6_TRITR|nr:nuclear envelope phosphatase regulatory subunit [Trichuris trichiura]
MDACEGDLKAFERRLMEVVSFMQPDAKKWRGLLTTTLCFLLLSAYHWLSDPLTAEGRLLASLWNNKFFSFSLFCTIVLLLSGVHKRIVAPNIIVSRCRTVLTEYNMSCDDVSTFFIFSGRLKLKPRPPSP